MSDKVEPLVITDPRTRVRTVGRRGLQVIEEMAAGGKADYTIARALNMNRCTFREIRKRQPDVEEA